MKKNGLKIGLLLSLCLPGACKEDSFAGQSKAPATQPTVTSTPITNTVVPTSTPVVTPTGITQIDFGTNTIYHLGDNNFGETSQCFAEVKAHTVSGKRYFFEFEVLTDASAVTIAIEKICGLDANTNTIKLVSSSSVATTTTTTTTGNIYQATFARAATRHDVPVQTLNRGTYKIIIESGLTSSSETSGSSSSPFPSFPGFPVPGGSNSSDGGQGQDYDDFIVGNVKVNSPASSLRMVRVGAE